MVFSNFQTFLIYIIPTIFFAMVLKISKKKRIGTIIIGMIPLLIVSYIRNEVGTDFSSYYSIFIRYQDMSFYQLLKEGNIEIGYFFLNKIAHIFNSFNIVLLLSSFLTLFFPIYAIRNNKKISVPLFSILYVLLFYFPAFNNIRQGIAISFFFYGMYKYLYENNKLKLLFSMLLSISFHMSSLLLIPIIFIKNKKKEFNTKYAILVCIILLIVSLNLDIIFKILSNLPFLSKYLIYDTNLDSNNLSFYLVLLIGIFIVNLRKYISRYDKNIPYLIFFSIIDILSTYTGFTMVFLKRIALYFNVFNIIVFSSIHKIFHFKQSAIIKTLVLIYGITMFILYYWYIGHSNLFPFKI